MQTNGTPAPLRVGVIGCGGQGRYNLERLLRVPGVSCVAACDVYDLNLRGMGDYARLGESDLTADYRRLLERPDVDAVMIATPPTTHCAITLAALQAGKHVFCEKLMATEIADAQSMVRAADASGLVLQIGHQRAASPGYRHARRLLREENACGRITHVRAHWNRNGSWRRSVPPNGKIAADAATWQDAEHLVNWRLYNRTSAGLMAELGSHQIHIVNWFLDSTPLAVMGVGGVDYWQDGRDVWDNAQCIFEYPGVVMTYQSLTTNQFDGFQEEFLGDRGTLITTVGDDGRDRGWLYREPQAERLEWEEYAQRQAGIYGRDGIVLSAGASTRLATGAKLDETPLPHDSDDRDAYEWEFIRWAASIREGDPIACDAREGLKTTVATLKANEAMRLKTRVEIPDALYEMT